MNRLIAFFMCMLLGTVTIDAQFKRSIDDAPRHRIMVGIGGPPITPGGEILEFRHYHYDDAPPPYGGGNILDYYYDKYRVYEGETLTTGAIFAEYGYRIKKWFDLGINITYTGFITRLHDIETHKKVGNENYFYISAIPTARFVWVRSNHINLYSGIGLGLSYSTEEKNYSGCRIESSIYPAFNITPIGIMVGGRRVFGFSEFCIGYSGIFNIGVGVRL
jgi:hypothetical protein